MENIQHYRWFISTTERRIWGDAFAQSEERVTEMVRNLFPWLSSVFNYDLDDAGYTPDEAEEECGILCYKVDWEDNRPDQTEECIVQFNSWHQHASLDWKD